MSDSEHLRTVPPTGDVARRRALVVMAGFTGDVTEVRAALTDPEPAVRAAALGAISRTGDLTGADLGQALADPSPVVLRRAAHLAGNRPELDVDGPLASLLDHADPAVVEVAAFACGERPGSAPQTVLRLADLATDHGDALCREAAVAALGAIGDPVGLDAVLAGCRDKATVRRRAVLALAAFDGPEVSRELELLCQDRDLQVRQAAEELRAIETGEGR